MSTPYSIYIHIPFCKQKCGYCDFLSFAGDGSMDEYVKTLCDELSHSSKANEHRELVSVFIGGGTPTHLPVNHLERILQTLVKHYELNENTEFTIEANPESITKEKLELFKKFGVNRLSIGVQAFDDRMLQTIGRVHSSDKAIDAYELARAAGFRNINLDLMFGLPGQDMADWEKTIRLALSLSPQHLSCYSLIMEEGAAFAKIAIDLPDEDTEREMYYLANRLLDVMGYKRYEISNYAKSGFECRHNIVYWTLGEYISFGLGAHSFTQNVRYHNTSDMKEYLSGDYSKREVIKLSSNDLYSEFMFLGMRMTEGVSERDFEAQFNLSMRRIFGSKLQKLEAQGLVINDGDRFYLSDRGIDLSNMVFVELLLD